MSRFRLDGRLALVTGGSRGIGFGAAKALAESGAGVILVGRNEAELQKKAEELRGIGPAVHVSPFDLADSQNIAAWFESITESIGSPDILINAAGMTRRGPAVELSLEDWNAVIALNTTAIFELSRQFAKKLLAAERGGRIINIASLMTAAARAGTSPYTASKGAVGQLTKALAVEWAKSGILVNAIAPGYIATELTEPLVNDEAFDTWVKQRCPLGRWGEPEDIAWPIVFLASEAAAFITGQVIYVDGGWLATF
ncbi:SDR family NAD(P)-dependent oxidoreductase [Silvibacterium acidisoli]|uniref:SDR family NAD(P)-dependent oxidoreductase n=1 Tax=Acidobacteriaceae bacterium ZG23-2 TaxID=2883246 RepID=UPI00406CF104